MPDLENKIDFSEFDSYIRDMGLDPKETPTDIKELIINTIIRQRVKSQKDKVLALSKDKSTEKLFTYNDSRYRMLTEGVLDIDFAVSDEKRIIFTSGFCKRILDKIPDDYVGKINEGHTSFVNNLVLLGRYKKEDFIYNVDENGKGYLDFTPRLDTTLGRVKDIINQGYPVGISAELSNLKFDLEKSEEQGCPVAYDGELTGIAVVGASGDPNAGNIILSMKESEIDMAEQITNKEGMKEFLKNLEETPEVSAFLGMQEVKDLKEKVELSNEEKPEVEAKPETPQKEVELEQKPSDVGVKEKLQDMEKQLEKVGELIKENKELKSKVEELEKEVEQKEKVNSAILKTVEKTFGKIKAVEETNPAVEEKPKQEEVNLSKNPTNLAAEQIEAQRIMGVLK